MARQVPDEVMLARLRREAAARDALEAALRQQIADLAGDFKSQLTQLESRFQRADGGPLSTARIVEIREVLAGDNYAMAQRIDRLEVKLDGDERNPSAFIDELRRVEVTADSALAETKLHLHAEIAGNKADFEQALISYATIDYAETKKTEALTASTAYTNAQITSEQTARANADSAFATSLSSLTVTVNGNTAAITSETTARATADSALATSISSLTTTVNGNTAAINSETTARSNADSSLATSISSLTTTVNGNTAAINSEVTARSNADSALTSSISSLTSTVNGHTASINSEVTTRASADGTVAARATLEVNANGHIAGYRIGSAGNLAGNTTSQFIIRADVFAITDGTSSVAPFSVSGGVTTIQNARIGGLTINSDRLASGDIIIGSTRGVGLQCISPDATARVSLGPTAQPAFTILDSGGVFKGGLYANLIPGTGIVTTLQCHGMVANGITANLYLATPYLESGVTTATDVKNGNFRVFNGGSQTARIDYSTGCYFVQGNQVVGPRQSRGSASLADVVALLDAWGAWA